MEQSIFHRLSSVLWGLAVTLIVLLAVYVSAGRLLSSNLGFYQEQILAELNSRVPFQIEASGLRGEWQSFTPQLVLSDLRLSTRSGDTPPLVLSGGRIGLDVLDSLLSRSLQFTTLELQALALQGEMTPEGRLRITGLSGNGGEIGRWLREFLLNIERVTLSDNRLYLRLPSGEQRELALDLSLQREGSQRYLQADLVSARGTRIRAIGEGLGNPFKPDQFSGDLYLDISSGDLGAVKDMLASGPPGGVWAEGELGLQLWLDWDRGAAGVDARIEARDVVLAPEDGAWQVPLDHLAFTASLVERRKRWALFAADLELSQGEVTALLPRVQVDAWDQSLRLRAEGVALEPLNSLLLGLEAAPKGLLAVFDVLRPAGQLDALQINVGDITKPATDWTVEANFSELAVQSWRGAPGVTNASGYVDLAPGGGYVVLDSQQFTMAFPTVYRDPLFYDDFHGTINLSWDSQDLLLESGAVTARAAEGTATALFRLNIPLRPSEVGLEMDLMVGLENSHPIHRVKYVPYVLNPSLLDWLSGAIGEGDVEEAGFIWRGSLRRGASALRTVQLFLNVEDTALDYHPQWPSVTGVDGTVLIDDTNVSVWADRAELFQSEVRRLSAEAWLSPEKHMLLAINGQMSGPAADGLAVVNKSLLGELVGGTFREWQATGELETRLDLLLNLTDKSVPPGVDVETRWRDVDLRIQPGNLQVEGVSGDLAYSSQRGFSSEGLDGIFWGQPLKAGIRQQPGPDGRLDAGGGILEVQLAAQVAMADVQDWLKLDSLALATGATAVNGAIRIAPGEAPLLLLDSKLQGVALDLPEPWYKGADSELPLNLQFPLAGEQQVLSLALAPDLRLDLDLDLAEGGLQAAALAVATEPAALQPGELLITGHAPLVEVEGWLDFVDRYFIAAPVTEDAAVSVDVAENGAGMPLVINLQALQADQVAVWGQQFNDVNFDLRIDDGGSRLLARTDWLQAELVQPADGSLSTLDLAYFDLAGLESPAQEEGEPVTDESGPPAPPVELPPVAVSVADLRQGDRSLGHLDFRLHTEGEVLYANDITGELAAMQLTAEAPGKLQWSQVPGASGTELAATLQFSDFGATLQALGYEKFLETEQGQLDLALQWPGAPQEFALSQASGSINIDVGRGRFLETPAGATGALRVVSIFNLADMVQRASLSQMFESGIPFHNLDGEVYLHGGTIEVAGINVQGSSSGFYFSGVSDVASRSLDGELVATLPVANNLPWVAALAAASWPVAAGVFVVSKVFEDQVNRLSSGVYSLDGTWDDPEVKFDRIFADAGRNAGRTQLDPNAPLLEADPNQLDRIANELFRLDPNQLLRTDPRTVVPDPQEPAGVQSPLP